MKYCLQRNLFLKWIYSFRSWPKNLPNHLLFSTNAKFPEKQPFFALSIPLRNLWKSSSGNCIYLAAFTALSSQRKNIRINFLLNLIKQRWNNPWAFQKINHIVTNLLRRSTDMIKWTTTVVQCIATWNNNLK